MQMAAALSVVPRSPKSRSAAELAEFRFESDAALERALALAAEQSWIAGCSVDRARRTLRVTLSPGTAQAAVLRRRASGASIH